MGVCEGGDARPTPARVSLADAKSGRDGGIRTHDPLTPSQVRYQAALHPDVRTLSDVYAERLRGELDSCGADEAGGCAACRRRPASRAATTAAVARGGSRRASAELGGARRARSKSRIDRRPRLTSVSRSRALLADQLVDHRRVGGHRRRLFLELPPRAGKRQPFDEQQVLDPDDLLDILAAINPRPAGRPSRRQGPGTPPPTNAARTAAP